MGEKKPVSGEEFLAGLERFGEKLNTIADHTNQLADALTNAQGAMEEFLEAARGFVEAHPELVEADEALIPYPECAQLPACPNPDLCHYYDPEIPGCGRWVDDEARAKRDAEVLDDGYPPPPAGGKGD